MRYAGFARLDRQDDLLRFAARFIMEVLRNIESDDVLLKFRDSLSPVLVTPSKESEEDDDKHEYMCVIMPMRV